MKKTIVYILMIICLLGFVEVFGYSVGSGAAAVLRFGQDARAMGMGGAFVALANNYSAPYWNPAGTAISNGSRLGAMYTQPYQVEDLNLALISGKSHIGNLGLGGAYSTFFTSFPASWSGNGGQILTYSESLYLATGALQLEKLGMLGGSVKYYSFAAPGAGVEGGNISAHGLGFDLGILYSVQTPSITLGAALIDFGDTDIEWTGGSDEAPDKVPAMYRIGAAYSLTSRGLLAAFGYDVTTNHTGNVIRLGVEYKPILKLAIRSGLVIPADEHMFFTVGASVSIGDWNIDFAWMENRTGLSQAAGGTAGDTIILSAEFVT